ncbi:MAG: hypothetical protein HXY40_13460 [Chloroflexi bacterium]|nr:hypothetical protein [Chloroflexota bacterium]
MGSTSDPQETQIEMVTAALLVVLLALFLVGRVEDPLAMLLGGLILLASGVYQSMRGWHVAMTTWALGIILFLGGIGVRLFLVAYVNVNYVALGLALVGGYMLWQLLRRK